MLRYKNWKINIKFAMPSMNKFSLDPSNTSWVLLEVWTSMTFAMLLEPSLKRMRKTRKMMRKPVPKRNAMERRANVVDVAEIDIIIEMIM